MTEPARQNPPAQRRGATGPGPEAQTRRARAPGPRRRAPPSPAPLRSAPAAADIRRGCCCAGEAAGPASRPARGALPNSPRYLRASGEHRPPAPTSRPGARTLRLRGAQPTGPDGVTGRADRAQAHGVREGRGETETQTAPSAHVQSAGVGAGGARMRPARPLRNGRGRFWKVLGSLSCCLAAGAGGCSGRCVLTGLCRRLLPGRSRLARRYGGDARSGALSSGVAAGAGAVRGQPGRLGPVSGGGAPWGSSRLARWGRLRLFGAVRGRCSVSGELAAGSPWRDGGRALLTGVSLGCRSAQVSHGNQHPGCPAAPSGKCPQTASEAACRPSQFSPLTRSGGCARFAGLGGDARVVSPMSAVGS